MKKERISRLSLSLILMLSAFVGCGGGSGGGESGISSNTSSFPSKITGYFIDEPVKGIKVENQNKDVVYSNEDGEFQISANIGEQISFYIGNLYIGEYTVTSDSVNVVTPPMLNTDKASEIVAILKALDEDKNTKNGIQLPKNIYFPDALSIEDIPSGATIKVEIEGKEKAIVLKQDEEYSASFLNLVGKASTLMALYQNENILASEVQVHDNAKLTHIYYNNFRFDPKKLITLADYYVRGKIFGTVNAYGDTYKVERGDFECYAKNMEGSFNKINNYYTVNLQYTCTLNAKVSDGEETYDVDDTAVCTGKLTVPESEVDWINKTVTGQFSISCSFNEYSFLNFSYTNQLILQGK